MSDRTGMFHIYTGNGKGKTTALLGLSVRAACSGMSVYIGQFMKGQDYSELCLPRRFEEITIEQFGTPEFIHPREEPTPEQLEGGRQGIAAVREAMRSGVYRLVAADEICVAVYLGVVSEAEALALAGERPPDTELVFTGRYATEGMVKIADLVTEMVEVKHYYNDGKFPARRGIEN